MAKVKNTFAGITFNQNRSSDSYTFKMKSLKVKYNTVSRRRQEWRDRLQLLGAAIGIVIGYMESFHIYTGISIVLPITGFVIAFVNILFVKFYKNLVQKYGRKFEFILLRINGLVMLITGIGFHITGSKYIQYAYYLVAILYMIVFPFFIYPMKKKNLVLLFTPFEFIAHKRIRVIKTPWKDIDRVRIQKDLIEVKQKKHPKIDRYFIEPTVEKYAEIFDCIDTLKSENGYRFEIQKIL